MNAVIRDVRRGFLYPKVFVERTQTIHSGCPCLGHSRANPFEKQARSLKKMMVGSIKPKKKFFLEDSTPAKQLKDLIFLDGFQGSKLGNKGRAKHRAKVLDRVFAEKITSILSTGEAGGELIGMNVQITRIKISPNFAVLQVYWEAPNSSFSAEHIQKELDKVSWNLRHILITLRVIGMVPPIQFIEDPVTSRFREIEDALKDVGHSLEPENAAAETSFADDVLHNAEENEAEGILTESLETILEGPKMTNNILGLKHDVLMQKVKDGVARSMKRGKHATDSTTPMFGVIDVSGPEVDSDRAKTFLRYLENQRRDKLRQEKFQSKEFMEYEFKVNEMLERMKLAEESRYALGGNQEEEDYYEEDTSSR